MMIKFARAASAAALLLANMACSAGDPFDVPASPEGEQLMLKRMAVEPGAKVSYLDLRGKSITFAEFVVQAKGQSMSMSKNIEDKSVQFQVLKPRSAAEVAAEHAKEEAAFKVKVGQALPDFLLRGLDGKLHDRGTLAGKYSVISFFFEACAPCIAEVPSLNKFRELHPELNLVAMTFDDQAKAQRFQDRHKLNWPVLIESRPFNQRLGITSYPSFVVLDPQGRFLGYRQLGQVPNEEEAAGRAEHAALAAWVKQLIDKDKGG